MKKLTIFIFSIFLMLSKNQAQNAPIYFFNDNLESVNFNDDTNTPITMFSFYGINQEEHLYHRTISQWNGLGYFKTRKKFYRQVIFRILFQPEFSSLQYFQHVTTINENEKSQLISLLVKFSGFDVFTLEELSHLKWLKYNKNVKISDYVFNKIKRSMRQIRKGKFTNLKAALNAINAIIAGIEFADNSYKIYELFVLLKAFSMDMALQRMAILKSLPITDKAYWEALDEVYKQIRNFDNSTFWQKMLNAYRLNPNTFQNAEISALSFSEALIDVFTSVNPWIKSFIFTSEQGLLIKNHWDNLKITTISATLYKNLLKNYKDDLSIDCILYSEYLFSKHYSQAFNNKYIQFLTLINPSYENFINYLQNNSKKFKTQLLKYYLENQMPSSENSPYFISPKLIVSQITTTGIMQIWTCDVNGDRNLDKVKILFKMNADLILFTTLGGMKITLKQDMGSQLDLHDYPIPKFTNDRIVFTNGKNRFFENVDMEVTFCFKKTSARISRSILMAKFRLSGSGLGATNPGEECTSFIPFDNHKMKYLQGNTFCGIASDVPQKEDHYAIIRILEPLHWYSFISHADVLYIHHAYVWDWQNMEPKDISSQLYENEYAETLNILQSYLHYAIAHHLDKDTNNIKKDIKKVRDLMQLSKVTYLNSKNKTIKNKNKVGMNTGYITDIDDHVYKIVRIGNQWWMAENLKVTHFRNGDPIPNVPETESWKNLTSAAYCSYNNDKKNKQIYGLLYNWFAVNDSRNIAPEGWHVATDADWNALANYVKNNSGKLKEAGTAHWKSPNTGATNETGFTALPGGNRYKNGTFSGLEYYGNFWTATQMSTTTAYYRGIGYNNTSIIRSIYNKRCGFLVRCVKNK